MPTCPNCGEIIMNGDPYCPHCGATFKWGHDDEEEEERPFVEFKSEFELSKNAYERGNYLAALTFLISASKYYKSLSYEEMRSLGKDPFNKDWVVETCCNVINNHRNHNQSAVNLIAEYLMPISLCPDCDLFYLERYNYCMKCGKILDKPFKELAVEKSKKYIRTVLDRMFVDDFNINRLVERSAVLMRSNGCRLDEIYKGIGINFIFIKEHRYFYTAYICTYIDGMHEFGRIFEDCDVRHNYDNLLSNPSFKKLVKDTETKTGFHFKECGGGYGMKLDYSAGDDFIFTDDYNLHVIFGTDDGHEAIYDIDLDKMELSKEYRLY